MEVLVRVVLNVEQEAVEVFGGLLKVGINFGVVDQFTGRAVSRFYLCKEVVETGCNVLQIVDGLGQIGMGQAIADRLNI